MTDNDHSRSDFVRDHVAYKGKQGAREAAAQAAFDKKTGGPPRAATPAAGVKPDPVAPAGPQQLVSAKGRVPVVNATPARLIVRGTPTGEQYVFPPGATLQVRVEDLPHLRNWNRSGKRGCCGGGAERTYFQFPA
jgi:hypothetical protein